MLVWSEVSVFRRSLRVKLPPAASRPELSNPPCFCTVICLHFCLYFIFFCRPPPIHSFLAHTHTFSSVEFRSSRQIGRAHTENTQAKRSDFSSAQLLSRVFICLLTPLHRVRQATVAPFQQQLPVCSVCVCVRARALACMAARSLELCVRSEWRGLFTVPRATLTHTNMCTESPCSRVQTDSAL